MLRRVTRLLSLAKHGIAKTFVAIMFGRRAAFSEVENYIADCAPQDYLEVSGPCVDP